MCQSTPASALAEVLDRASRARHVVVVGPAGSGKSTLVATMGRRVVDDAEALSEQAVAALVASVAAGEDLAVAYRATPNPWLPALLAELEPSVVRVRLGPWGHDRVEEFLRERTGHPPAAGQVEALLERTAGVPAFLVAALSADPVGALAPVVDGLGDDARRVLLAVVLGAPLDLDLLASALGTDASAVDAARAAGVLGPDGGVPPVVADAVRALTPVDERVRMARTLLRLQRDRGQSIRALATSLLDLPGAVADQAGTLAAAASEALRDDPALAVRFLAAAADLGGSAVELAPLAAEAHALSGDLDSALRAADLAASSADERVRSAGALVSGMVLARRGELGRAAEVVAGVDRPEAVDLAAFAFVATGEPRRAAEVLDAAAPPSTVAAGITRRMARGLLTTVGNAPATALSTLVGAASAESPAVLLPDSPAAVAAHVCLHLVELPMARAVLDKGVLTPRHRVLSAWAAMLSGDLAHAEHRLGGPRPEPRDALLAAAVELGLARRRNDLPGMERGWENAYHALLGQPVDLFTLLPLGEIVVAAARLGRAHQVAGHLDLAWDLVDRCGDPPAWTVLLRWSALHAALVTGESAATQVEALGRYRTSAGRVVAAAARCLLAVSRGDVDADAVEEAALGLHGQGLRWDAARLAGQAAIRTGDRATITRLLEVARRLAPADQVETRLLTEREREVGALVLDGLTYKQVGDRLFISGKTVEHHVTRMRQKLGCSTRRDLLAVLGDLLGET
ncbi:LuxR C-terminal-related transcriptional regulator [Umezawaea sp. NPDC059074]|uniref:LuxR C-terminal-related transcriptional regulator n=1 Tax=Umezawaea sp. NPDC059074 TaxID=3346716 RepID=UPI0036886132